MWSTIPIHGVQLYAYRHVVVWAVLHNYAPLMYRNESLIEMLSARIILATYRAKHADCVSCEGRRVHSHSLSISYLLGCVVIKLTEVQLQYGTTQY